MRQIVAPLYLSHFLNNNFLQMKSFQAMSNRYNQSSFTPFTIMPVNLTRPVLCTLMLLWGGLLHAEERPHPSYGLQMQPLKSNHTAGEACADTVPNHPLNLFEAVNLALCNNPQTREMWSNVQAQSAQLEISKASEYPNIALNAAANRNWPANTTAINQQSIGLSASYLLYDFGARSANLESAIQLLAAANATQDSTLQTVFLAAVQAFYQTQAALAALDAAQISEHSAQESFAAAQARYAAGSATPADKLSAQTAYSQATLNRITAEGNLRKSQGALANVMGLDANKNVTLTNANTAVLPNNFSENIDALIEQARQRRPDLHSVVAQVKAAQANTDATRAAGKPTIALSAANNQNNSGGINSHSSSVGINISVPIFSGYAPTYRVRAAEAQVDAKNAQLERLRLQIALDVWTAYQNLTTATQALQTTADLLDSATQSEHVALGRYKAGMSNMLDVLNAQSALANARQQRVQATFNWNISRAALGQAMGNLDAGLLQTLSANSPTP
jgi:TolC family type I secretion outer membrane protein